MTQRMILLHMACLVIYQDNYLFKNMMNKNLLKNNQVIW
jgi:hypothetical protein